MKKKIFSMLILFLGIFACKNEMSLQEFYVKNQDDKQYLALDIPASLLTGENPQLTPEQKATLETIKKINILGFPKKEGNETALLEEQEKLSKILRADKYKLLIKYGGANRKAELYYMGKEDAIDELIVYGSDDEKGFGIARVTGNDMNPDALIKLFKTMEKNDLNIQGLQYLQTMFED